MTANKIQFIDGNLLFSYDNGITDTAIKAFVQVTGAEMLEGNLIRVIRQNGSDFYTFNWRKITKLIGKSGALAVPTSKEAFYKIIFEEFLVATSGGLPTGAATEEKQEEIIALLDDFATKTENQPVVSKNSFFSDVALGLIPGVKNFPKQGFNNNVTTTQRMLNSAGTALEILTVAAPITFVSTDANDTALGTGARTLLITGVDAGGIEQTETLPLNGTTPVVTVNSWLGVLNRVQVISAGSGQKNAGVITGTNSGKTYSTMPIGLSIAKQLCFYVPKGKKALIKSYLFDIGKNGNPEITINIFFYALVAGVRTEVYAWKLSYATSSNDTVTRNFECPKAFTENSIWWVEASTVANTAAVISEIEQVLFDN